MQRVIFVCVLLMVKEIITKTYASKGFVFSTLEEAEAYDKFYLPIGDLNELFCIFNLGGQMNAPPEDDLVRIKVFRTLRRIEDITGDTYA